MTLRLLIPAALILLVPSVAPAHLAMLRQGPETADMPGTGEEFGRALAVGDFDGDGFDDLAIGAPFESNDVANEAAHGSVTVSYGAEPGFIPGHAQFLTVGALSDLSVQYGASLAAGDFNKDGYDDLAVGLPHRDVSGDASAGAVWIHYGSAAGINTVPGLVLTQASAPAAAVEANDQFGSALASGDFDGDGTDDLAVGARGEDTGAGIVFDFYGDVSGLTTVGSGWFKQSTLGQANTANDAFGFALAAGDVDGDGDDDLAVGAPYKTVSGLDDAGRVYLLRGTASGLAAAGAVVLDRPALSLDPQDDALFGYSLAMGRILDTTGPLDLAVGEPAADVSGFSDTGRVLLLDYDAAPATPLVPSGTRTLYQGLNSIAGGLEVGDLFGSTLAVGRYNADLYDDLAVGIPYENRELGDEGSFLDAGMVAILHGGSPGPPSSPVELLTATSQNDETFTGDYFGWAVAFGRFDEGVRRNLAVGAIRRTYLKFNGTTSIDDAGQVYIVAPWRQIQNLPHRTSVALDCQGNIAYSQRLFDQVRPASTTKTMTLLLACEALSAGSADEDYLYTVPNWVAANVGGSQMGLIAGETITLGNLLKGMMTVSGNDAAYAIADILEGDDNPWGGNYEMTLPGFQARMNDRADDLAMNLTTLTNPPGLDVANHYTTALDFARLSHAAMQHPCVRQIVGQEDWLLTHSIPVDTYDGWLSLGGGPPTGFLEVTENFHNGYLENIRGADPWATGIKGGHTGGGRVTGLWSSASQQGEVYATAFGMRTLEDDDPVEDCLSCTGGGLLSVGRAACDHGTIVVAPPPPPGPFGTFTNRPACVDVVSRLSMAGEAFQPGDALFEVYRRNQTTPPIGARLVVVRSAEFPLVPQEMVGFGIAGIAGHEGARITNRGTTPATIVISATHPAGTNVTASIPVSGSFPVPRHDGAATQFAMTIRNIGSGDIRLEVEELGYRFEVQLPAMSSNQPSFATTLRREGRFLDELMGVYLVGTDSDCDDELDLVVRPPGGASAVPVDPPPSDAPAVRLFDRLSPNPFADRARLEFRLPAPSPVDITVFDLQGRRIRRLLVAAPLPAGPHAVEWDGRDERGAATPAGIYLVRIEAAGRRDAARLVRIN